MLATIQQGDLLEIAHLRKEIERGEPILVQNHSRRKSYRMTHQLSARQINILLAGGLTPYFRKNGGSSP